MHKPLPTLNVGEKPVVLLVGNGISIVNGTERWQDFIKSIQKVELSESQFETLDKLPLPMQPIVVTGDDVIQGMRDKAKNLIDAPINDECCKIVQTIADISPDVILTTNYTYELEKGLLDDFSCKAGRPCKYRCKSVNQTSSRSLAALYQYFQVNGSMVWHIHGEAAKPDTMIIGHYYYGNTLSMIQQYMHGLISRYKSHIKKGYPFQPKSWVDYFMIGEVYTIGYGCSLHEMDFWWLVNCKKLNFSDESCGKIHIYEPSISPEIQLLANAYNVDVISARKPVNYMEYYQKTIEEIGKMKNNF